MAETTKTIDEYEASATLNEEDLFLIAKYSATQGKYVDYNKLAFSDLKVLIENIISTNLESFRAEIELQLAQKNEEIATLTSKNETLTQANATLTSENETLTQTNTALTSENATLTSKKETLTQTNTELTSENETLTQANTELTSENETLTQNNTNLTTENTTLTSENEALTQANNELTAENEVLKPQAELNLEELEATVTELQSLVTE